MSAEIYTLPTAEHPEGKRIPVGEKPDPKIIGPDDHAVYEPRKPDEVKDVPNVLIDVEVKHLLPIARSLGNAIGIACLQEAQYGNVLQQIRERSVFVVLNVLKAKIDSGVAVYHGIVVMCKRHPIVRVVCKCHLATGRFGVAQVHLWHKDVSLKDGGEYHIYGDPNGKRPMALEDVVPLVMEYLENREKVLTLA